MKPEEIVVGGVYEGGNHISRLVLGFREAGLRCLVDYRVVAFGGSTFMHGGKSMVRLTEFAKWATKRVDTEAK